MLLGLTVLLISKAFIALTVYQAISKFKEEYSADFLLTYQWISSSFDGVVSIKGVEITPYTMKKTFEIDDIEFKYLDYPSLLLQLSTLHTGNISGLVEVSLPTIRTALDGKNFKELVSTELSPIWFTPFNLYGCGEYSAVSEKEFELMGVKQHSMSLQIKLAHMNSDFEKLSLHLDRQELGEFKVTAKLPTNALQHAISSKSLDALALHFVGLEYQDAGFFRRLNILCNQHGPENRSVFSLMAAAQWKDAMYAKGLFVNEALINTYSDYLLQGGSIALDITPKDAVKLTDLNGFLDKELMHYLDANILLNGKPVNDAQFYLDSKTLFPPPVIEKAPAPKVIAPKQPAGYRMISKELVVEYLERKIRVVMQDGKQYEGLLTETTEYNLELTQHLPGGAVNYPLMLNQVATVEVWFNQEQ